MLICLVFLCFLVPKGFCYNCKEQEFWNDVEDNCPNTFFRMAVQNYTRQGSHFFFHMLDKKFTETKKSDAEKMHKYQTTTVVKNKRDTEARYLPFSDLLSELFPANNNLGSGNSGIFSKPESITFPDSLSNPVYNSPDQKIPDYYNTPLNSGPYSGGNPGLLNCNCNGYSNRPESSLYTNPNPGYPTKPGLNNGFQSAQTGAQNNYKNQKPSVRPTQAQTPNKCINLRDRIVGGAAIDITDAPYQVLYDDKCGGAILSEDWVVTAAHCQDTGTFVRAGFTNRIQAPKYEICSHHIHPNWKRSSHVFDYDFQLLLLRHPLTMSMSVIPIAIGDDRDLYPGRQVYVSGWGYTRENANNMVQQLRGVQVPIIPDSHCKRVPAELYRITDRMFCAGYYEGGQDACQGDSGGPAVLNGKLVGLVSFGAGCGRTGRPGVYSKLTTVKNWVSRITGIRY